MFNSRAAAGATTVLCAGLTSHHRNTSRTTPLKGKGCPPPDRYEPEFKPSKRFITGRSFAAHKDILHHYDEFVPLTPPSPAGSRSSPSSMTPSSLSKSMDSAMLSLAVRQASQQDVPWGFSSGPSRPGSALSTTSSAPSQQRLCFKLTELSHRCSLKGPGLSIIEEVSGGWAATLSLLTRPPMRAPSPLS